MVSLAFDQEVAMMRAAKVRETKRLIAEEKESERVAGERPGSDQA